MSGPLDRLPDHRDRRHRPRPVRAMMLADMGAEVDPRRPRPDRARPAPGRRRRPTCSLRGRRTIAVDLKHPDGVGDAARPRRAGRRADRGLPARRDGAARPRPRRVPRPQPEARLRPHDRLGPGRPVRAGRRPRHQLHRARRRARPTRPGRRGAGAAAQPGRRLRRRRHVPRLRRGVRAARGAAQRRGPGGRRGDGRRRGGADDDVLGDSGRWACSTRTSAAPTCSTPAPTSTTSTRCADGKYVSIGSIEPQFYAELLRLTGLDRRRRVRQADGQGAVAGAEGAARRGVQDQDPRRVVRDHGAHRRLLRPGADDERGRRAPAQRRPRARSSRSTASCSRRRRRGSAARRPRSQRRRRTPASTPRGPRRLGRSTPTAIDALVESGAVK